MTPSASTPTATTTDPLADLDAQIAALETQTRHLDSLHSEAWSGVRALDPDGRAVPAANGGLRWHVPSSAELRRSYVAVSVREQFFRLDAELHDLKRQRAELALSRLPSDAAVDREIADAGEVFDRAKAEFTKARGRFWAARGDGEATKARRLQLAREIAAFTAEAGASRARAQRHAQELVKLAPFAPVEEPASSETTA